MSRIIMFKLKENKKPKRAFCICDDELIIANIIHGKFHVDIRVCRQTAQMRDQQNKSFVIFFKQK